MKEKNLAFPRELMPKSPPIPKALREYFAECGKLSGQGMTPEERRARALKANAASHKAKAAKKARLAETPTPSHK